MRRIVITEEEHAALMNAITYHSVALKRTIDAGTTDTPQDSGDQYALAERLRHKLTSAVKIHRLPFRVYCGDMLAPLTLTGKELSERAEVAA